MAYSEWGFMGMHFLWWIFWLLAAGVFMALMLFAPTQSAARETPRERLLRHFIDGKITQKEYEARKAVLDEDRADDIKT